MSNQSWIPDKQIVSLFRSKPRRSMPEHTCSVRSSKTKITFPPHRLHENNTHHRDRCKHVLRRIQNQKSLIMCKITLPKVCVNKKTKIFELKQDVLYIHLESRRCVGCAALFLRMQVTMTSHQLSPRICPLRISFL